MVISSEDFGFVRRVVREDAGISLEDGKEYLVEMRLTSLARKLGIGSAKDLISRLRTETKPVIRRRITEAMTTNESSFFRDAHPFEALKVHLLPELIKKRSAERKISIWCAASSSGQEPYSIAMLIREHFPELATWQVKIIATDISDAVLAQAREGRYSQLEVNRGLPATMLVRHFRPDKSEWVLKDDVRKMVSFQNLNLISPLPVLPQFDMVFIRNVLIYFTLATKQEILQKIAKVLRPDGYLFLGSTETTLNLDVPYERIPVAKTVYFRPAKPAVAMPSSLAFSAAKKSS